MKYSLILLLIASFYSCQSDEFKDDVKLKKDIIGEWYCDSVAYLVTDSTKKGPAPLPYLIRNGYLFSADDSFELKQGFHKLIESHDYGGIFQFIGYKTTFNIEKENLKIFDISQNDWRSQKILKLTKDSLWLLRLNPLFPYQYIEKYARFQAKSSKNLAVDKIVMSLVGAFGVHPTFKIIINTNGKAQFFGERHTRMNGYFTTTVPKEKLEDIFNQFRKVDLKMLSNNFDSHNSDDNTILISFWKDNKQVKAVRDYGRVSPSAFVCGYQRLQNLYQELNWTAIDKKQFDAHYLTPAQ